MVGPPDFTGDTVSRASRPTKEKPKVLVPWVRYSFMEAIPRLHSFKILSNVEEVCLPTTKPSEYVLYALRIQIEYGQVNMDKRKNSNQVWIDKKLYEKLRKMRQTMERHESMSAFVGNLLQEIADGKLVDRAFVADDEGFKKATAIWKELYEKTLELLKDVNSQKEKRP